MIIGYARRRLPRGIIQMPQSWIKFCWKASNPPDVTKSITGRESSSLLN
jgi:hypothetical protein